MRQIRSGAEFHNCESLPIALPDEHFLGRDAIWGREVAAQAHLVLSDQKVDERVGALFNVSDELHVHGQDANLTVPSKAYLLVDSSFLLFSEAKIVCFSNLEQKRSNFEQAQVELDFRADKAKEFEQ